MTRCFFAASLAFVALGCAAVEAAPQLASHRAVYTMTFGTARSGSSMVDARGVMVLEWAEACDGWTVSQRVKLMLYSAQGAEIDADSNFSSWESKDGTSYRFTTRNLRNGKVTDDLRGSARRDGASQTGKAIFDSPSGMSFELPKGALFPTEHVAQLIARAQAGERRFSRVMFDGATSGGPMEVNAIVGAPIAPTATADALTRQTSWPVRMAFFSTRSQQAAPEQEVSVRLYDNGVADDFVLDYGDFTVKAVAEKMESVPAASCR